MRFAVLVGTCFSFLWEIFWGFFLRESLGTSHTRDLVPPRDAPFLHMTPFCARAVVSASSEAPTPFSAFRLSFSSVLQKDQLNLQGVEMLSLRESLHVEQQRYRQLWEDRETVVTRLHCQIRQLQQGRDDYYTKNQELQVQ